MAKPAPTPVDTLDFQFKLRCRLKVFQNDQNEIFNKNCDIIAVASKYGLLFVGTCSPCFQAIQIESLDKFTTKDGEVTDYNRRMIPLPSQPKHIAVNCDSTKLSVIVDKDSCVKAVIYDVASFLKQNVSVIQEIRLSATPGVSILETSWNPAIPSIFTVCKDDGSLGIYELKDSGIEINELPSMARVTCMCWSPKGKQIAVGSRDGKITQYKPDLKVAKIINAPTLERPQYVVALQWVSNYQFIGVYRPSDPEGQLSLLVVDAPKTGETVFTNYEDICYSYGNTRPHQFYLNLQSTWNILMVASSNSMEVGVLAFEKDIWTQWILADSARAELPLTFQRQDTLPVGMALDTSSTQCLPWGETTLQPMPLLLLLSHHGVLCCFSAINLKKDAASVCHPPEKLQDVSGLMQFTKTSGNTSSSAVIPSKPIAINPTKQNVQQTVSSAPAFSFNQASNLNVVKPTVANLTQTQVTTNAAPSFLGFKTSTTAAKSQAATTQSQLFFNSQPLFGNSTQISKPEGQFTVKPSAPLDSTTKMQFQQQPFVVKPIPNEAKSVSNVAAIAPVTIAASTQKLPVQSVDVAVLNEDTEALMAQMVREECTMLESELMFLLHQGHDLKVELGTDDEATSMVQKTNSLQKFVQEAVETSSSQAAEVHNLKQSLMQTWVWYEEARSRFATFKDPKLIALMHAQPLDPASERQLSDIRHLFYYIESQLNQANVALDEQWENFQDSCKKKLSYQMPSIEAIYQSMVKQNATLQKQMYILKDLSNRIRSKQRNNQVPKLLVSLENVDKLEEQLKSLHFQPKDVLHLQHERTLNRQKLLTETKAEKLKNLLLKRKIVHVSVSKPQLTNSAVHLNGLIGAPFSPIVAKKKLQPQKLDFLQSTPKSADVFPKPPPVVTGIPATAPAFTIPTTAKTQAVSLITTKSSVSSVVSKAQSNMTFPANKSVSAPSVSIWAPNVNIFGGSDTKTSLGSAFVPTTQNVSLGVKSSGSLFGNSSLSSSNSSSQVSVAFPTSATTVKVTLAAKSAGSTPSFTNPEQKLTFSFNTPVSVTSSTTIAKTVVTTTSTRIFTAPVSSSTPDNQKPFAFSTKPSSATSGSFSFQTLAAGSNPNNPSPFAAFNFTTAQKSATGGTSLIKPSTTSVFSSSAVSITAVSRPTSSTILTIPRTANISEAPSSTTASSVNAVKNAASNVAPTTPAPVRFNFGTAVTTSAASLPGSLSPASTITSPTATTVVTVTKPAVTTSAATVTESSALITEINSSQPDAVSSTTQIASIFEIPTPNSGTQTTSIFGSPLSKMPTAVSSQVSIFGSPVTTVTLTLPLVVNISTEAKTLSAIASNADSTQVSAISSSVSAHNVTSSTSDSSVTSTIVSQPSIFGAPADVSQSPVCGPGGEVSLTPVSTTTSQSIFGSVSSPSLFGKPATNQGSLFGGYNTPSQPSIFDSKSAAATTTTTTSSALFIAPSTSASIFSKPATDTTSGLIFGASPGPFGNSTTQGSIFGTPANSTSTTADGIFGAANKTIFGASTTSAFGVPKTTSVETFSSSSIFGTPTSSVFGTPKTSTDFGTPTTSTVFGTPTTASIFGTPTTSVFRTSSSLFGAPSSVFGTTNTSSAGFGGFGPVASTTPAFGQSASFGSGSIFNAPATTSSGSIFGSPVSNSSVVFGNPNTSSVFGTSTSSAPFGSSSVFGAPTTGTSPFRSSSSTFGSSQANTFSFAAAANTANVSSSETGFGFNKPSFGFGGTSGNTDSNSFSFGSLSVGSPTTTSSSFSSGFGQTQNPFGRPSGEEQKSPFGSGSLFGSPAATSSSSVFGGSSPFSKSTPAFGSGATFGTTQGFGQQSSFGQSNFGSSNVFGGSSQPGPFSSSNQSVSQSGFGSTGAFAKPSGFGTASAFGSAYTGGFGAPPAFGGTPTFGSTTAFGSPSKVFGVGGTTASDAFGSAGQQNSTFANLATQPTLGFGNLAQQSQTPTSQPTGFSGNSSFSSWR